MTVFLFAIGIVMFFSTIGQYVTLKLLQGLLSIVGSFAVFIWLAVVFYVKVTAN